MDALSEALVAVRATGAIFVRIQCTAPWGFTVPDVSASAPLLSPGTERILHYHLITAGRARVSLDGDPDFWAEEGDIVILPHGDAHSVSNGAPVELVDSARALRDAFSGRPAAFQLGDGAGEVTEIVCGFMGCDRSADRLFLAGLPRSLRIGLRDGAGGHWLVEAIEHLVVEAASERPGAAILLSRMAESLFVETLRRFMAELPDAQTGWLAGARDPSVGAVLALLHRSPAHRWTLEELARTVGVSRSVLAKRFSRLLQCSPADYLRRWRLQLAAERLRTSRDTILQIAADVGYDSEAAFNRAFRTAFGAPPAQYRRRLREAPDGESDRLTRDSV